MKRIWLAATAMGAVFAACALGGSAAAQDADDVQIIRGDALQEVGDAPPPPPRLVHVAPAEGAAAAARPRVTRITSVRGNIKPEIADDALLGATDAQARGPAPASAAPASANASAASVARATAMAPESEAKSDAESDAESDVEPEIESASLTAPSSAAPAAAPAATVAATRLAAPHARPIRAGDINGIVLSALSCSSADCGDTETGFPGAALTGEMADGTLDNQRVAGLFQSMMASVWTEQQQRAIAMIGYYSAAATLCENAELDADAVTRVVRANFTLAPGATDDQVRYRRDALSMHIGMAAGLAMGAHIENTQDFCDAAANNRHNFATPLLHQVAAPEPELEPDLEPNLDATGDIPPPPPLPTPLASR